MNEKHVVFNTVNHYCETVLILLFSERKLARKGTI